MEENTVADEYPLDDARFAQADAQRPILMALEGDRVHSRHKINRPLMLLGRDPSCDIPFLDTKCSRRHAELRYANFDETGAVPLVHLRDLQSTNGIFVNGLKVAEVELKDRDKIVIGSTVFGYFIRDDSTLKAEERMIEMATVDPLTGLHNRGVFDTELAREYARARRYGRELSLVMFDIDHFKRFNDAYGHQTGDRILRELGGIVRANMRVSDHSARYGGEEFALILTETSLDCGLIQAERLRRSIADNGFSRDGTSLSVTVSAGIAELLPSFQDSGDLIKAADAALYRAKSLGRDRVCRFDPSDRTRADPDAPTAIPSA